MKNKEIIASKYLEKYLKNRVNDKGNNCTEERKFLVEIMVIRRLLMMTEVLLWLSGVVCLATQEHLIGFVWFFVAWTLSLIKETRDEVRISYWLVNVDLMEDALEFVKAMIINGNKK